MRDYTLDKRNECLNEREGEGNKEREINKKRERDKERMSKSKGGKRREIKGRRRAEGVFRGVAVPHDYREDRSARGESSKHQRGTRLAREIARGFIRQISSLPGPSLPQHTPCDAYIYVCTCFIHACLYSKPNIP